MSTIVRITPKNLRSAADLLEAQRYLVKNEYCDFGFNLDTGEETGQYCYCTMGAIAEAKDGHPDDLFDPDPFADVKVEFFSDHFLTAAGKAFGWRESDIRPSHSRSESLFGFITKWNDNEGRRPKTAANRLRKVAEIMEANGWAW